MDDDTWNSFLVNELNDGVPGAEPKAIRMWIKTPGNESGHYFVVVRNDDGFFETMDHTNSTLPRRGQKLSDFSEKDRRIINNLHRVPKK